MQSDRFSIVWQVGESSFTVSVPRRLHPAASYMSFVVINQARPDSLWAMSLRELLQKLEVTLRTSKRAIRSFRHLRCPGMLFDRW